MTLINDDRLTALLGTAAEAFDVPESGAIEILERALAQAGAHSGGVGADDADDPGGGSTRTGGAGERVDEDADEHTAGDVDGSGRGGRIVSVARRHRLLSVAAGIVVVLVVAGTIGAIVRSPSSPTTNSALARTPRSATGVGGTSAGGGFGTGALNPVTTTTPGSHPPAAAGLGAAPTGTATGPASGSSALSAPSSPTTPPLPSGAVGQSTKIEQTGTLGLTVKRGQLAQALTRLTALADSSGGFVANAQSQSGSDGTPYGTITLQVPVGTFNDVLKAAERYGKQTNVSTKATDVTGQYVDLQARLMALEASRQQYLTVLAKATSIGDILSVQEQIDGIQQQIEQLQGQLQVLTSETSYSTLNVTLAEEGAPPRPGPLPESGLVRAWHDSVGGFVAGVEGVIRLAGPFLFALLCLAIAAVGGRVLWRRYQRHRL